MSSRSDDLEFNPFYQALQNQFLPQYEQAQQRCWLVCIPRTASLGGCTITRQFIDKHLLQPSPLLRDHYESTMGGRRVIWRLSDKSLETYSNSEVRMKVRVLGEELAYNKSLRQFKMFILEQPLDPNYKPTSSIRESQLTLKPRKTFRENKELLESFHNHFEALAELTRRIATFERNYLIVEVESLLQDTAQKLESIAKQASNNFIEMNRRDTRLQDRRIHEAVWQAIESFLMHKVHSKVYPAVCKVLSREDRAFSERCRRLRGHLTPSVIGVPEDYNCRYSKTLNILGQVEQYTTPLEKLYCLHDAMESIMDDVKEHFTRTLRHGEPRPLPSDDLIVLLATILTQSDCAHLPSSLYYMEHFHWSQTDADKLSYVLVTFRAAVEYLRGPEAERLLPREEEKRETQLNTQLCYEPEAVSKLEVSSDNRGSPSPTAPTSSISSILLASMAAPLEQQQQITTSRKGPSRMKENKELGPFLSRLLETDDTVTSSSFD